MNDRFDIFDEIDRLLGLGWTSEEFNVPISRRYAQSYLDAMEPPVPTRPLPASSIQGHHTVRCEKDRNMCRWTVYGGEKLLFQIPWRLAFDDSEIWGMVDADQRISALYACIATAALDEEDEEILRKRFKGLPSQVISTRDSLWARTPVRQSYDAEDDDFDEPPPPKKPVQRSTLCLKRKTYA